MFNRTMHLDYYEHKLTFPWENVKRNSFTLSGVKIRNKAKIECISWYSPQADPNHPEVQYKRVELINQY